MEILIRSLLWGIIVTSIGGEIIQVNSLGVFIVLISGLLLYVL